MGQRLDRLSSASQPVGSGVGSTATLPSSTSSPTTGAASSSTVPASLSNTFSSSSSSSTSSSSSSSNNNSNRHQHHHPHRTAGRSSRAASSATIEPAPTSSSLNSASSQDLTNMSPRTRFRTEMSRRGYTTSSSDLFFRLFQFPTSTSSASAPSHTAPATASNDAAATTTASSPTSSSGLSAFRFFNLGGGHGSGGNSNNIADLDSDLSSDEDEPHWNHNLNSIAHSLPFFFGMRDFKCFVCNKLIPADDVETHVMMCLTKPRLTYNDDVLTDEKGECIICFEILEKGQTIARLPCLCIYHKHCIDSWLTRSQSCPGHPPD